MQIRETKWYIHDKTLRPDSEVSGFKVPTLNSRYQILWRPVQTGEFLLFRIRLLSCKRQNQSGTKTFRRRHDSGTISSGAGEPSLRDSRFICRQVY